MLENYDHKYKDDNGRLIFVPTDKAREIGAALVGRVLKRWTPPAFCYHFQPGGHVEAAKAHLGNHLFVRMDIKRFYNSVTRTKVCRSLESIHIKPKQAWEIAKFATVSKSPKGGGGPFSLPFGFVQSPLLATLALMSSALGAVISDIHAAGSVTITAYMDDILLSGADEADLAAAKARLEEAAVVAGFTFNTAKGTGPATSVTVFNLIITHGSLVITDERIAEFEEAIVSQRDDYVTNGILGYVGTVNPDQRAVLEAV